MTDLQPYFVAVGGMILLMSLWVVVQQAWKRVFPGARDDDDALAGRVGCGDCSHEGHCDVPVSGPDEAKTCPQHSEIGRPSV